MSPRHHTIPASHSPTHRPHQPLGRRDCLTLLPTAAPAGPSWCPSPRPLGRSRPHPRLLRPQPPAPASLPPIRAPKPEPDPVTALRVALASPSPSPAIPVGPGSGAAPGKAGGPAPGGKERPRAAGHSLFGGRHLGCVLENEVDPEGLLQKQWPLLVSGPLPARLCGWERGEAARLQASSSPTTGSPPTPPQFHGACTPTQTWGPHLRKEAPEGRAQGAQALSPHHTPFLGQLDTALCWGRREPDHSPARGGLPGTAGKWPQNW